MTITDLLEETQLRQLAPLGEVLFREEKMSKSVSVHFVCHAINFSVSNRHIIPLSISLDSRVLRKRVCTNKRSYHETTVVFILCVRANFKHCPVALQYNTRSLSWGCLNSEFSFFIIGTIPRLKNIFWSTIYLLSEREWWNAYVSQGYKRYVKWK